MRRVVIPELLDTDAGTAEEIAASLRDLRRINRCFGGVRTTRMMIERVARRTGGRELSLLEVAAGSGDVAIAVQRGLQARGVTLSVTLLDRSFKHLRHADVQPHSTDSGGSRGVRRIVGDALALPFARRSFDIVSCGLFVHHLEPGELQRFGREALRVCRVAVLMNDLRRSCISLALVHAGFPLFRSRLTRHDGPASVRRAYTMAELRAILRSVPAQQVEIRRRYLFRMGTIVWK